MSASPHHVLLSSVHPSSPCTTFFCLSRLHVFLHSVSKHSLCTTFFCLSLFPNYFILSIKLSRDYFLLSIFCNVLLSSIYQSSLCTTFFYLSTRCTTFLCISPLLVLLSSVHRPYICILFLLPIIYFCYLPAHALLFDTT